MSVLLQAAVDGTEIPADNPAVAEEDLYSSWALLILITLLAGALWTSYFLQLRKIRAIHETVVSIVAGMIVGFIIRVSPGSIIQDMVTFNHAYFFNLLLPPIILNYGYELKRAHFFRNFGGIMTFAFLGTLISTMIIGFLIWLVALTGVEGVSLSWIDSFIFGAILSSTDPVTVLAIFSQLKVDPKLYALIFGESMLNDAVAIVLFGTLENFRGQDFHLRNIGLGIGYFLGVFFGSLVIGVIVGALMALVLKHSLLRKFPAIESCLVALTAYATYLLSNGLKLSGIVSLLFCGISMKHYAYDNMSLRTRRTTKYMFQVLARLTENFIFISLGITLFTARDEVFKPFMIIVTTIIMVIARYCSVFSLANVINLFTIKILQRPQESLSRGHTIMIFWAGLRGAVAFALAYNIKGSAGAWLRTTILCVVVISVIAFGGTTSMMLTRLGVRTGVAEEKDSDSEREDGDGEDEQGPGGDGDAEGRRSASRDPVYIDWGDDDASTQPNADADRGRGSSVQDGIARTSTAASLEDSIPGDLGAPNTLALEEGSISQNRRRLRNSRDEGHWFLAFDNRYIKPFLSRLPKPLITSPHLRTSDTGSLQDRFLDVHIPPSSQRQSSGNETLRGSFGSPNPKPTRLITKSPSPPSPLPNDGEIHLQFHNADPDPPNLSLLPSPANRS